MSLIALLIVIILFFQLPYFIDLARKIKIAKGILRIIPMDALIESSALRAAIISKNLLVLFK
jgi:hypothetical protein